MRIRQINDTKSMFCAFKSSGTNQQLDNFHDLLMDPDARSSLLQYRHHSFSALVTDVRSQWDLVLSQGRYRPVAGGIARQTASSSAEVRRCNSVVPKYELWSAQKHFRRQRGASFVIPSIRSPC